jgi:hypothetical protein
MTGMQPRLKQGLIGALVVAGIAAGGFAWQHRHGAQSTTAARVTPGPRALQSASAPAPTRNRVVPVLPVSLPIDADAAPVSVQVERLLAAHDPQKTYAAYWLVKSCAALNARHEFNIYDTRLRTERAMTSDEKRSLDKMCGGLTERERQSRLDYLAIAVKAGLSGAAWQFAAEGPFGDPTALQTRPDDPLVREWKASAATQLRQAADAGDPATLLVWSIQHLEGSDLADKNPALAYRYMIAFGLIAADQFGPANSAARMYADGSASMDAFQFGLTPEQRAAEQAAARRIADEARRRRNRG